MPDRTFGWVQDPGEFSRLRRVVEAFDPTTATYGDLVANRIPRLVTDPAVRTRLLAALASSPLRLSYADLRGRRDTCDGIIQVLLPGQNHPCLSEWAAENFVRWAHALGFIEYNNSNDTFALSSVGKQYIDTPVDAEGVNAVLEDALLSYPPVVRVLRLLSGGNHLTKFEIGRRLGFVGENGFTSLPQDLLIRDLVIESDPRKRREMLSDWDGTSDKYARMIAGWLQRVGWITQQAKTVSARIGSRLYSYDIPQAYTITGAGLGAFRRAEGQSRYRRTNKNVFFEMLATKATSRKYLRRRRALILNALDQSSFRTIAQIQARLTQIGITVDDSTILDDLTGFENIGLQIDRNAAGGYRLIDSIQNLNIPQFTVAETLPGDVQRLKESVRTQLHHVQHDRMVLIDLSFDSSQSRLFEIQTMDLLLSCGYKGAHLGGANRPDGAVYTEGLQRNYGLIVDTKAYRGGFACAANERREMQNYIQENMDRPISHPTDWWSVFPSEIQPPADFYFLFVSSRFVGDYANQFTRLSNITEGTLGAGITAANLLLFAEALLAGEITLEDGYGLFGSLGEVVI